METITLAKSPVIKEYIAGNKYKRGNIFYDDTGKLYVVLNGYNSDNTLQQNIDDGFVQSVGGSGGNGVEIRSESPTNTGTGELMVSEPILEVLYIISKSQDDTSWRLITPPYSIDDKTITVSPVIPTTDDIVLLYFTLGDNQLEPSYVTQNEFNSKTDNLQSQVNTLGEKVDDIVYPVTSVNTKKGDVLLSASDILTSNGFSIETKTVQYDAYGNRITTLENATILTDGTTVLGNGKTIPLSAANTGGSMKGPYDTLSDIVAPQEGIIYIVGTDPYTQYMLNAEDNIMVDIGGTINLSDYYNKSLVDQKDSATLTTAKTYSDTVDADLDTHRSTDRFRWQSEYDTERESIIRDANLEGLKADEEHTVIVNAPTDPMTVSDEFGGVIGITFRNEENSYCIITINGQEKYSSEGLTYGVPVTKHYLLEVGSVISATNAETFEYTPFIPDETSPFSKTYATIDQLNAEIADLQQQILDLKASIESKVLDDSNSVDITNTIYTVTNELGGRLNGVGVRTIGLLGIVLLSTGIVTLNLTEIYNNTSLLTVGDAPLLSREVKNGDSIVSTGMETLIFTPYISG